MNVPPRFLPRVMRVLVSAGLAEAHAGRSGGYRLARPATDITILDIVLAVEPDDERPQCVLRGIPCGSSGFCLVHETFADARAALRDRLAASTLAIVTRPQDPRRGHPARADRAGWPIAFPDTDGED
jgi:Rrf2 family protein